MGTGGEGEPWALDVGTWRCKMLQDSLISQEGGWFIGVMALTSGEMGRGWAPGLYVVGVVGKQYL